MLVSRDMFPDIEEKEWQSVIKQVQESISQLKYPEKYKEKRNALIEEFGEDNLLIKMLDVYFEYV